MLSNQVQERLSGLFTLSHVVSITLPSTVDIDNQADSSLLAKVYDYCLTNMSETFGGATVTNGQGAWYSNDLGKLVFESVNIVTSFAAELSDHEISRMIDMAEFVKAELRQESVLVNLNGKAYLV